jgi:hypothetical protein
MMGALLSSSVALLVSGVMTLLLVGFLALVIAFTRARKPGGAAVEKAAPKPLQPTGKVEIPPAAPVEGGDREEVTFKTLAVASNRPFLKMVSGPSRSEETFFLSATRATTIGRSPSNDIVLSEGAASTEHCRIEKQADTFVLIDLDSTNKTWVNGAEKSRVVLRNGDRIKIGETTMVFVLFGERASPNTLKRLLRPLPKV